jgi:hypothetical protein
MISTIIGMNFQSDMLMFYRTAKGHKKVPIATCIQADNQERNWFVTALQQISFHNSVRITILGGDVHLGAIGQFYSNKNLAIPKVNDHRFMTNVIHDNFPANSRLYRPLLSTPLLLKLWATCCTIPFLNHSLIH